MKFKPFMGPWVAVVWLLWAGWAGSSLAQTPWPHGVKPVDMLAAHNAWRAKVGVPELLYSEALAQSSQAWAEHLKAQQGCRMQHSGAPMVGENLFWAGAWSNGPAQIVLARHVVDAWGAEVADYDHQNNRCAPGKECGHYTQVVWKGSTHVGCGMALCDKPRDQVWVCQYTPAGNMIGEWPY